MSEKYTVGPDIDLDVEEIFEPDGTALTEQRAQDIAEETLAIVRRGGPALDRGHVHSPRSASASPKRPGTEQHSGHEPRAARSPS